ncbi:MAG: hypothetical protein Q8R15_02930 [Candidatus Micrarchaeota archaeon]|nr:hypothetical protein [Candidatus Micrarchaeota archaeon]
MQMSNLRRSFEGITFRTAGAVLAHAQAIGREIAESHGVTPYALRRDQKETLLGEIKELQRNPSAGTHHSIIHSLIAIGYTHSQISKHFKTGRTGIPRVHEQALAFLTNIYRKPGPPQVPDTYKNLTEFRSELITLHKRMEPEPQQSLLPSVALQGLLNHHKAGRITKREALILALDAMGHKRWKIARELKVSNSWISNLASRARHKITLGNGE